MRGVKAFLIDPSGPRPMRIVDEADPLAAAAIRAHTEPA